MLVQPQCSRSDEQRTPFARTRGKATPPRQPGRSKRKQKNAPGDARTSPGPAQEANAPMQDKSNQPDTGPRSDSPPGKDTTTAQEDAKVQRAVLLVALDHHPAQLTLAELVRETAADPADFGELDAGERAVADLVGAGLLHRNGELVLPTRAAIRFDELVGDRGEL